MSLTTGTQLGSYEVLSLLGKGGMGEVYRARDTKLKREVAIKTLPEEFSRDPERLARFQREAEALAALNHPNIGSIYHLQELDGSRYLVLELVEGDTLADILGKRGALPIDEAIRIAKQICEALEAAHEKGITHRDLKPANIKITPDGKVKLLDFGLARAFEQSSNVNLSNSPTTVGDSTAGVILGTAAYMSPEQARGELADKRSDIWAFGCVLYEMLSGRPVFAGQTLTEVLGAVMYKEVDRAALPAATPANVRQVLLLCLQRDRTRRLRDIGDVRLDIEDAPVEPAKSTSRRTKEIVLAVIAVGFAVAAAVGWLRPQPVDNVITSQLAFTLSEPAGVTLSAISGFNPPEISPDGSSVLYSASNGWNVRRLDSFSPQLLQGLQVYAPFWSPDSKWVVGASTGKLVRVRVPDGAPEVIASLPGPYRGGTWSENGTILVSVLTQGSARLLSLPPGQTELKPVDVAGMKAFGYLSPEFLPGGEDFLVFSRSLTDATDEGGDILLATLLDGKVVNSSRLMRNETNARYTPAGDGSILFIRNDKLYCQRLNRKTRKLEDEARLVNDAVASVPGGIPRGEFSVSRAGEIAFRAGRAAVAQVTAFDRSGNQVGQVGPLGNRYSLDLSPDDARLLSSTPSQTSLLVVGQPGQVNLTQGSWNWWLWSPDGSSLFGISTETHQIGERPLNGGNVTEFGTVPFTFPDDVSPDGNDLLFHASDSAIVSVRLHGSPDERAPRTLVPDREAASTPRFSPDGHWIVYSLKEGVFVQPFPGPGLRKQIAGVGRCPVWRKDGKEIVYLGGEGSLWSIGIESTANGPMFGAPLKLFSGLREPAQANSASRLLAVSHDGSRIYYPQAVEQPNSDVIQIRMGWFKSALKPN